MSRFLFEAKPPAVVASLTEAGVAWARVQPKTTVRLIDAELPFSATHLPNHVQACKQDIRACKDLQGAHRTLWVLGSFWLNTWVQPRPTGVASLHELEGLVKARATQLFGPAPDGKPWMVSADWKSQGAFVCYAVPSSVIEAFGADDTVQSPLKLALDAARRVPELQAGGQTVWMAFTAPGETHLVAFQRGYPVALTSRRSPVTAQTSEVLDQAVTLWRVEQARTGQRSDRLFWLNAALKDLPLDRDARQGVTRLNIPWLRPADTSEALLPVERWLAWTVGVQRDFT